MKLIVAMVRSEIADAVVEALRLEQMHDVSVSAVKHSGGEEAKMSRVEVRAWEHFANDVVATIANAVRETGSADGEILVMPLEQVRRIAVTDPSLLAGSREHHLHWV